VVPNEGFRAEWLIDVTTEANWRHLCVIFLILLSLPVSIGLDSYDAGEKEMKEDE